MPDGVLIHKVRVETVWKLGWRGVNEARSLACNAKIRSPCPSMSACVAPVWCPSGLSRQSLYSTLAIWPYDTPHKVGSLQSPMGLFAGRSPTATRKKSPTENRGCVDSRLSREVG